jgi:hypothetical protein
MVPMTSVTKDSLEAFMAIATFRALGLCPRTTRTSSPRAGLLRTALSPRPRSGRQAPASLSAAHQRAKLVAPRAAWTIVKESPALALVDAHNGIGTVAAARAMRLAIQKAKVCGIGRSSYATPHTTARAPCMPARPPMPAVIGIAITNAGPEMAPWGAREGAVGHQPVGNRRAHGSWISRGARHRADDGRQGHDAVARARGTADASRLGADARRARNRRSERRHGRRAAGDRRSTRGTASPS